MVDKNSIFGGMLTTQGAAKKTNCDALGIPWEPRYMLIGDANGTDPVPSQSQTKLINQVYRAQLNQLRVSPTDENVLIAELVLPPDVGGWWIRELALEDKDGVFSAVANAAPSYKPLLDQGSGRNQVVRMHVITSGTSNIQLKIDPSVVLATREYVDAKILEELYKLDSKQSVRVATTANIVLSGLQLIDGVALAVGDRVLVKSQAAAKDNGIWVAAAAGWSRAADADSNTEVTSALLVSVEQGATLADTRWQLITDGAIVLGTTALTFQNVTQGFAPINSPALIDPTANTPPQFDNTKALATAEFVQRALGSFSAYLELNVSTVLTAADVGKVIKSGGVDLTLPALSSVPNGAAIMVRTGQGGRLLVQGIDQLFGSIGVLATPYLVVQPQVFCIVKVGTVWQILSGDGALPSSALFASTLGPSAASQTLPGLTIKVGNIVNDSTAASIPLMFPVAFPVACIALVFTSWNVMGYQYTHNGRNRAGADIWRGSNPKYQLDYIAIGY